MKSVLLKIENGATVEKSLKELAVAALKTEAAYHILATGKESDKTSFFPMLFSSPENVMNNAFPLAPVMPINAASALSNICKGEMLPDIKILAFLRPCESRAAIELIKMKQIDSDKIILAVFDCMGTISSKEHRKLAAEGKTDTLPEMAIQALAEGVTLTETREACGVCRFHSADNSAADIVVGLAGIAENNMILQAQTNAGETFLDKVEQQQDFFDMNEEIVEKRSAALSKLMNSIEQYREKIEADHKSMMQGFDGMADTLKDCIGCHACMRVCPLCFCNHCFFESKQVVSDMAHYRRTADSRDGVRVPDDRLFYHLGRMSHMALSCVSCGLCEDACNMGVPVGAFFRQASAATAPVFSYEAGRDREENFPLADFRCDELHDYERPYEPCEG